MGQGFSGLGNDFVVMSRSLEFIKSFNRQADYVRSTFTPADRIRCARARVFAEGRQGRQPWSDDFSKPFCGVEADLLMRAACIGYSRSPYS